MRSRAGRFSSRIGRRLFLALAASGALAAQEPPPPATTPPPASPLPSTYPQTVEFSLTGANGTPMDKKLFGFELPDVRCLWWHWEAPETGWYAIDRPDEPDGPSDEFPMGFVFARAADGTLNQKSEYEAWNWYRAAWFWAPRGERFSFAVAAKPGSGRWRLRRLATQPVPPGEEAIVIPSETGFLATWKLTRSRMGKDEAPNEVIEVHDERTRWAFRESPLPTKYFARGPFHDFAWSWEVPRTGTFELIEPPDGDIDLKEPEIDGRRTLSLRTAQQLFQVAAPVGQRLEFSLHLPRVDSEALVKIREVPRPTNTTPDMAIFLEGVSGEISVLNPDALGPADAPPGTYHPDRWPLWWKFVAPTDGRFTLETTAIKPRSYKDVRQEPFTLAGRLQVRHPHSENVAATFSEEITSADNPSEWLLSPGDIIWIRASSPEIFFAWSWQGE